MGTARSWETQGKIRGNTGKIGGKSEETQENLGENQRKHKKTWGKIREIMGKFREKSGEIQGKLSSGGLEQKLLMEKLISWRSGDTRELPALHHPGGTQGILPSCRNPEFWIILDCNQDLRIGE